MDIPNKISAEEYKEFLRTGRLTADKKGKLRKTNLLPEYEKIINTIINNGFIHIDIKPLSVNEAWQGRRFKTPKYIEYTKCLLSKLMPITLPKAPYRVCYTFGLSNVLSDWDNPCKPFQDILQEKYGFNDKHIFEAIVKKVKVVKGEEFIEFKIESL